ncbi:PREDICTED: putative uncharacterized protein FLJ37770, partial [Dinoponera quadriceps]|uniref:Protein GVQW3-like n=1 Tax=Dinoponera quadriceps TaxID=609295 RepID=A0A6P3Y9B2_DINQU
DNSKMPILSFKKHYIIFGSPTDITSKNSTEHDVVRRGTFEEIHPKLTKVYGNSAPSISTVKKWAAEFKRGRTSLKDDPRKGRPKTATTPETIEKVHNIVLDDRRLKVCEIAEAVGISEEK